MSPKYSLNMKDLKDQARSAFIFLAPSILSFLITLTPAVNSLTANTTEKMVLIVAIKWGLDQLTGLVRRFIAGK